MRSLARVSRRAFHAVLLGGSASAVLPSEGGDVVIQESTFGLGRLTREQAQSFGPDLQTTDDLSVEAAALLRCLSSRLVWQCRSVWFLKPIRCGLSTTVCGRSGSHGLCSNVG